MKHILRTAMVLAFAFSAGIGHAADDKVLMTYKSAAGQGARYKSEGTLHLDVAGMKVNLEMKEIERVTYSAPLPNGDIKMERETESSETSFNGQKAPPGEVGKEKTTVVIHKDGALVSYKTVGSDHEDKTQVRLFVATSPVFPEKPIGVGEKWSRDYKSDSEMGLKQGHADYEILAAEKSSGADCFKLKMVYKETEGTPAISCTSIMWVEKSSGDTVSGDYEIDGLTLDLGGASATANGKVHGERLSGSPIGGGKAPDPKAEAVAAKKDKTIEEIVKDYEKLTGVYTLYRKKDSGRDTIYLELNEDQLDKLNMMQVTFSTGNGGSVMAGEPIDDILFKFVKQGDDKILFVTPNIQFTADQKKPISRAVKRSFPDAYLDSYRIEAKDSKKKSVLINISGLFVGDLAQISASISGGGGAMGYGMDREKTFIDSLKAFPENISVETAYHFFRGGGGGLAALLSGRTLADSRSMPLRVNYLVYPLKDNGYRPRVADPRVGFFNVDHEDFSDDSTDNNTTRYIRRWNLVKKDPKAKLSPPVQPIVFWLDNAIPLEYRDAVRDGVLFWNKAFEKAGFKDALEVKQMPDNADWDHADMRHNVIRWITSPWEGGALAIALMRWNPMTGEILNASVNIDANWTRYNKVERSFIVDPAAQFAEVAAPKRPDRDPSMCEYGKAGSEEAWFGETALEMLSSVNPKLDRKAYIGSFLRELVAHEVGHDLGLRHNFIASCFHSLEDLKNEKLIEQSGIAASVMDYVPFNISALKLRGVDYFSPTVGPYDVWAIEYGYTPIDAKTSDGEIWKLKEIASHCNEPGHAYQGDEIADQFDPAVSRYDLSSDPLSFWNRKMEVTRYLLFHMADQFPKKGESYWDFTRNFYRMLNQYTSAANFASKYIGGLHVNRNHKGDPNEKPTLAPVNPEAQRKALHLLNEYVFAEGAFALPPGYFGKLTTDPFPTIITLIMGGGASDFPILDTLTNIQKGALSRLFAPSTLRRISNNEYKAGDPSKAFTLPYLYKSVSGAVWSELDTRKPVNALRRQLQRNHLDTMISEALSSTSVPDDARMLAWDQLRQIRTRVAAARTKSADDYTRIHLEESLMRINRALEAKQTLSSGGGGGLSALQMLFGQEDKGQGQPVAQPQINSQVPAAFQVQPNPQEQPLPQPLPQFSGLQTRFSFGH